MPTIALVDDDRNILASVSIALESEGYRVQTYTDGASALDGFQTGMPDLAILDIKMPRMDGMELLRRLRQKTDVPVIFLTSKDDEIDELVGEFFGVEIEDAHPAQARHIGDAPHRVGQVRAVAQITAVGDCVLRNEIDLEHAGGDQALDLAHDVAHAAAHLGTAHRRPVPRPHGRGLVNR